MCIVNNTSNNDKNLLHNSLECELHCLKQSNASMMYILSLLNVSWVSSVYTDNAPLNASLHCSKEFKTIVMTELTPVVSDIFSFILFAKFEWSVDCVCCAFVRVILRERKKITYKEVRNLSVRE